MEIEKIYDKRDADICNELLNKLVDFESTYDCKINKGYKQNSFFTDNMKNPNNITFIAKADNKVIAFLNGFKKQQKGEFFKEGIAELNLFYVEENYRNKNIGTQLFDTFLDWCSKNNIQNVEVSCLINNSTALNFYKNKGFEPIRVELRKKI